LWQQITVVREWRGDAHLVVLADNGVGPCDCLVLHTASGGLPAALARRTRRWNDEEWAAATARLVARGWFDSATTGADTASADATNTGTTPVTITALTDAGRAARERMEAETDEHCAALWAPIGDAGARRLAALVAPITDAFTAAGTFQSLRPT
ncbi:hypothetical protein ACFWDP_39880, partial [Streptomyces anthocyanicus]